MPEDKPKPSAKPAAAKTDRREDAADLKPSDAEAPGPIHPDHESGSWEQTLEEQEAAEKERERRAK